MSEENVEIVRAQYTSFGQITEGGEVHSWVLGYFDPNCEYRPVEEVDAIRGHEALIEWTERWLEAWSSYSDQVEEIIDGGEIVVAAVSISGRGRTSGVEIRQRFFTSSRCARAGSFDCASTWTWTRPSKPPGWESKATSQETSRTFEHSWNHGVGRRGPRI